MTGFLTTQAVDLSESQVPVLIEEAGGIAGFDFREQPEYGSVGSAHGIRTKQYTYSRRLDSRTLFARDSGYGPGKDRGAWTGAKRPLEVACRRVLRAAGVPRAEIAVIESVTELGVSAEVVDEGESRISKPVALKRLAIARRSIEDLDVWQSYCSVELTSDGAVGNAELHWPEISSAVVREAALLRAEVLPRFEPAKIKGGEPESATVGILHSGAVGFLMEMRAAIRVIYASTDEHGGRKTVAYLDRSGGLIELPRDIVIDCHHPGDRPDSSWS